MDWARGHTIGRGSSASVSIATSRGSGEIFAVKFVELSQSHLLQREEKILSTLSSPHIVGYIGYDIIKENNKLMYNLLIEYVPGGTLTDTIRKCGGEGRVHESMIGYYTQQIVQGLEYLHSCGIAHCDIKGHNILIGKSGVKIADFGCAKWLINEVEEEKDSIGGTPMFMAPEVARGEEQGTPADIWALGCTLIEMATGGSPPWPNFTNPVSLLCRIAFSGELPEFPDCLSDQAKDFLGKCLRRDPKERWTAKQLLNHPFLVKHSNFQAKQNVDFNSNSPTSILDQGVWNSTQGLENLDVLIHASCLNSLAKRIARFSSFSGVSDWEWDENWITIRSNTTTICGAVSDSFNYSRHGIGSQ